MKFKFFNKIEMLPDRKIVLILFLLSFVLRFGYSLFAYFNNVMESFADDKGYFYLAKEIVSQSKIFYDAGLHSYAKLIGPGMPWINAFTIYLFGEYWLGIFFVTSIVSSLITVFTYKVALLVVDKSSALLAALWSCFYLFYIKLSATAGKDIWMAFFLIVIIYLLIVLFYNKKFSYPKFLLFMFLYVFSFHWDERFFVFAPFIFLYIIINESNFSVKLKFLKAGLFLGLLLIMMIPWTIRNYNEYDKIVLISTRTEIFTDKLFGYESREHIMDKYNDLKGYYYIYDFQMDSVMEGTKKVTDGGYKISEEQRQAMLNGNLPKPFTKLEAFWSRTKAMLMPFQISGEYQRTGYFFYEKSLMHNISSFLFYGLMFLFSFPGFFYLYKKNKHIFYLFLSTIIIYTLIHTFLIPYTNWRYRLPLDSLFIIVGSYGFFKLSNTVLTRWKKLKYPDKAQ